MISKIEQNTIERNNKIMGFVDSGKNFIEKSSEVQFESERVLNKISGFISTAEMVLIIFAIFCCLFGMIGIFKWLF